MLYLDFRRCVRYGISEEAEGNERWVGSDKAPELGVLKVELLVAVPHNAAHPRT